MTFARRPRQFSGRSYAPVTIVAAIAGVLGAALALGPSELLVVIVGGLVIVSAFPIAFMGVVASEYWVVFSAFPGGAGEAIVAVSAMGSAGFFLRFARQAETCDIRRLNVGHFALAAILALSLVNSSFVEDSVSSYVILSIFGSIPLAFVGATATLRSVPRSWLLLTATVPLGEVFNLFSFEQTNPIIAGHLAWITALFAFQLRRELPTPLVLLLIAVSIVSLLQGPSLGPKVAAGAVVAVAALQARTASAGDSQLGRSYGSRSRRARRMFAGLGCLVAAIGIGGAIRESNQVELNTTNYRSATWRQTLGDATFTGRGIIDVRTEFAGTDLQMSNHNFVLDSITGAGWIGFALMVYVMSRIVIAVRTSSHPLMPYCVGILVANSVSGGLFRSPSLWFALALLLAESSARSVSGDRPDGDATTGFPEGRPGRSSLFQTPVVGGRSAGRVG